MRKTNNSNYFEHPRKTIIYRYIICPRCREIPEIRFILDNTDIKIEKNCKCSYTIKNLSSFDTLFDIKEISLQNKCIRCYNEILNEKTYCSNCKGYFCYSCSLNNHNEHYNPLISLPNTKCAPHKKKLLYYCYDCNEDLCELCIKTHNDHEHKQLKDMISLNKLKEIEDELFIWHKEYSKYLLELREKIKIICNYRPPEYMIKNLSRVTTKDFTNVNKLFEKNLFQCNEIFKYIKIFIKAYEMFNDNLNHQIIYNVLNNTKINPFTVSVKNYVEYKEERVTEYLNSHFLIYLPHRYLNFCNYINMIKQITVTSNCICFIALNDGRYASCSNQAIFIYKIDLSLEETKIDRNNKIDLIFQLNEKYLVSTDNNIISIWSLRPLKKVLSVQSNKMEVRKIDKICKYSENEFIIISKNVFIYSFNEKEKKIKLTKVLSYQYEIVNAIVYHNKKLALSQGNYSLLFVEPQKSQKYIKRIKNVTSKNTKKLLYCNNRIYSSTHNYLYVISVFSYQIETVIYFDNNIDSINTIGQFNFLIITNHYYLQNLTLNHLKFEILNENQTLFYDYYENKSRFEVLCVSSIGYFICRYFNNIYLYYIEYH